MADLHPELKAAIDARLNDAVAAANYRITLNNQKQNARIKLQKDLTYAVNGGVFLISQELISFVQALIALNKEEAVLLDINKNPVEITDLKSFLSNVVSIYYERMNDYFIEYKAIQRSRNTKSLLGE